MYLIIAKLPLVCRKRQTLALVIVNYSKEIGCVKHKFPEIYLTFKNVENPGENGIPTQMSADSNACLQNCVRNTPITWQNQMFGKNLYLTLHF